MKAGMRRECEGLWQPYGHYVVPPFGLLQCEEDQDGTGPVLRTRGSRALG